MLQFYEPGAAIVEDSVAKTVERVNKTNKRALDFMFGVQKAMIEEAIFVTNEILDRGRTETQLFGEFLSKGIGAHSIKDLRALREEFGQHQIDLIRRDGERIFKHGERMIEATASLFNSPTQI